MFDRKRCSKYNKLLKTLKLIDWKDKRMSTSGIAMRRSPLPRTSPPRSKIPQRHQFCAHLEFLINANPACPNMQNTKAPARLRRWANRRRSVLLSCHSLRYCPCQNTTRIKNNNLSTARPASLKFVNWNWIDTPLWNEHEPNIDKRIETLLIRIDVHWWRKLQHNTWTITT